MKKLWEALWDEALGMIIWPIVIAMVIGAAFLFVRLGWI